METRPTQISAKPKTFSLIETFYKNLGYKTEGQNYKDIIPLMPALLVDVSNDLYRKTIKTLNLRFELKKWCKDWGTAYHLFNARYFGGYTPKQKAILCNMMDDFTEYIKKDAQVAYWQFSNIYNGEKKEVQDCLANSYLITSYIRCAIVLWEEMFVYVKRQQPATYLSAMEKNMILIREHFPRESNYIISERQREDIELSIHILSKRIIQFAKEYKYQEK